MIYGTDSEGYRLVVSGSERRMSNHASVSVDHTYVFEHIDGDSSPPFRLFLSGDGGSGDTYLPC
jgi:hypothetical protein